MKNNSISEQQLDEMIAQSLKKMYGENNTMNNPFAVEPNQQQSPSPNKKIKESDDQKLINIVSSNPLFYDDYDKIYSQISHNGASKIVDIESKEYVGWMVQQFVSQHKKFFPASSLKLLNLYLYSEARAKGNPIKIFNRFGYLNGSIFLDLQDSDGTIIEINANGWGKAVNSDVHFKAYFHMEKLPVPDKEGDLKDILKLFNIKSEYDKILILSWLITTMITTIPRPFLWITGEKGSAKTAMANMLKMLIDPMVTPIGIPGGISLDKRRLEVGQVLDHHALPFFDNVSEVSKEASDLFCLAYSNGIVSKRTLFTNADDFCFNTTSNAIFTCINMPKVGEDLLDRSIVINLERIPPDKRRPEGEIYQMFSKMYPKLLGGLLNALSLTMKNAPDVKLDNFSRTADFELWGSAAAIALGYDHKDFISSFRKDIYNQEQEILTKTESSLLDAVIMLMSNTPCWEGTPNELIDSLAQYVQRDVLPENSTWLGRKLNDILSILNENKISFEVQNKTSGRWYKLFKMDLENVNTDEPVKSYENNNHIHQLDYDFFEKDRKEVEELHMQLDWSYQNREEYDFRIIPDSIIDAYVNVLKIDLAEWDELSSKNLLTSEYLASVQNRFNEFFHKTFRTAEASSASLTPNQLIWFNTNYR